MPVHCDTQLLRMIVKTFTNRQSAWSLSQYCLGGLKQIQLFHEVRRKYEYRYVSTTVLQKLTN